MTEERKPQHSSILDRLDTDTRDPADIPTLSAALEVLDVLEARCDELVHDERQKPDGEQDQETITSLTDLAAECRRQRDAVSTREQAEEVLNVFGPRLRLLSRT